jgi:hypothetical protein
MGAVLEGFRGESSVADICRKYRSTRVCTIAGETGFGRWEAGYGYSEWLSLEIPMKARISELERITGQQTVQIEI